MYLPQTDVDFLRWIHDLLESRHGENPNTDYMQHLSKLADRLEDPINTLKPGDTIEIMDRMGTWHRAVFKAWVADGLGAEVEHEHFRTTGRLAIRKVTP